MRELSTLVQAAQRGDHRAFGEIVVRFQDMAYASAYAIVGDPEAARDAAQEAFLDAYCNLCALRDPAAFPGWFRRIVVGRSHRQLRHQPALTVPLEDVGTLYAEDPTPMAALETALLRHDVHAAIRALPPGQQQATVLYYMGGYSQREIADYLELSPAAVKKRLFDARQSLKERMAFMVQESIQQNKPSQDSKMARTIELFTALIAGDVQRVTALLDQDATLLTEQVQWEMALRTHYWPMGFTPLHLAVGRGHRALTELLLDRMKRAHVDIDVPSRGKITPLQIAAIMDRPALAELLIHNGANVNYRGGAGQTPLHHAALRNNERLVALMLNHGADVTLRNDRGLRAADWAANRGYEAVVAQLVSAGAASPTPAQRATLPRLTNSPILETGIKAIDLLTPLPRGGMAGIFTPLAGVGYMVVLGELMRAMQMMHGGDAIYMGVETFNNYAQDMALARREWGVGADTQFIFAGENDDLASRRKIVEQGLSSARTKRDKGREVLLLVDSNLATSDGVWPLLQAQQEEGVQRGHAITMIVHGKQTVELLPPPMDALETLITFDRTLARQRIYPAIDPVRSRSGLLATVLQGSEHAQVAAEVRRLLVRYTDLYPVVEAGGVEALWYIDDDDGVQRDVARARRLQRFLTQPFYSAEPWVGIMGASVPLAETVRGCREILEGQHDEVPEDAFLYAGAIDTVGTGS